MGHVCARMYPCTCIGRGVWVCVCVCMCVGVCVCACGGRAGGRVHVGGCVSVCVCGRRACVWLVKLNETNYKFTCVLRLNLKT